MIFEILDMFIVCPAEGQEKRCTGIIDFSCDPVRILDCNHECVPRNELGVVPSQGCIGIKNCDPCGKSFTKMLRSFGVPNETTTHLYLWYQESTSKNDNRIVSDTF